MTARPRRSPPAARCCRPAWSWSKGRSSAATRSSSASATGPLLALTGNRRGFDVQIASARRPGAIAPTQNLLTPFEQRAANLTLNAHMSVDLGRGFSAYASADVERICGHKSGEIEALLGYRGRDEIIHRDDLVVG